VGAGGRYNGLVSLLDGPDMPGIGFGTGVERILLAASAPEEAAGIDVFVVTLVPEARLPALRLATYLRSEGVSCDLDYGGRGGKGQFKQADRLSARRVVVLGEDELAGNYATLRDMDSGEQREVSLAGGYEALLAEL
jgi:histidyl-tRNA synthetase